MLVPFFVLLTAIAGSYFTNLGLGQWYQTINLPPWTPPGQVIGLIWTTIYILLSISLVLFINVSEKDDRFWLVMGVFLANLLLNAGWSYIFFIKHALFVAFLEATLLGGSVLALIFLVLPVSKLSAYFLIPYAAWVSFATFLSYNVWVLNR